MASNPQIDEICRQAKVSDYLANRGINVIKMGPSKRWMAKCSCPLPGHPSDSTPSFYISADPSGKEMFKCFGCSECGNIITLIRLMEGGKNGQIIRRLARSLGMELGAFSKAEEWRVDPTNDEILRSFCDEDILCQQFAVYALAIMDLHKGDPDIVDKISEVYKMLDDLVERGDGKGIMDAERKLKSILVEYK